MEKSAIWASAFFCILAFVSPATAWAAPAENNELIKRSLQVGNLRRFFWVHLPSGTKLDTPSPLVFVLHGAGGASAKLMSRRYGFNAIADRERFIVVYPYGVDGQWNDGRGKTFRHAKDNSSVDDVGFIDAIINELASEFAVDRQRIYVTGMSNGGMMTYRLGIELGSKLAAIAPMIANIPVNIANEKPSSPLPVLIMNGTDDPLVPWKGGQVRVFGSEYGEVVSTEQSVQYWLDCNKISSKPERVLLPDTAPSDGCRVELLTYRKEDSPLEVLLYAIRGGGHNIPGSNTVEMPRMLGRKCMDINASEIIWEFFKRHARNGTAQPL
jgi:polyhydroxybutyrate depolymerase